MRSARTWRSRWLTPRGDRQVVQEDEPLSIQTPREDDEDKLLEIFGSVSWSKSEASRKVGATGDLHRHFLRALFFILNLVEPRDGVPNREVL